MGYTTFSDNPICQNNQIPGDVIYMDAGQNHRVDAGNLSSGFMTVHAVQNHKRGRFQALNQAGIT